MNGRWLVPCLVLTGVASKASVAQTPGFYRDSAYLVTLGEHEQGLPIMVIGRYASNENPSLEKDVQRVLQRVFGERRGTVMKATSLPVASPQRPHVTLEFEWRRGGVEAIVARYCYSAKDPSLLEENKATRGEVNLNVGSLVPDFVQWMARQAAESRCDPPRTQSSRTYEVSPSNARPSQKDSLEIVPGRMYNARLLAPGDSLRDGEVGRMVVSPAVRVMKVGERIISRTAYEVKAQRGGESVEARHFTRVIDESVARFREGYLEAVAPGETIVEFGQILPGNPGYVSRVKARVTIRVVSP
jgi:hypothetical protein